MSRFTLTAAITSGTIVLSLILQLIIDRSFNLLHFYNTVFMVSLAILLIGLMLYVVKGGFFDVFTRSFKKFWRMLSKRSLYQSEVMDDSHFSLSQRIPAYVVTSFIASGLFLVIVTMIIAFFL
ncbi:hypothetical protein A374_14705 [Fictibacillus macauensis ZFHKF-1]|uniref:DUF3899 domain-containing protein n=1 Tax=Fictibacillus macauensis ZFHKF-1 TaxID=1196324 RepID=I8AG26_9BACL|nr:DUF3899 domain-containing protein [Fictibacillus macauensis]EIT84587.1 hypothetical protein A374_14705 [Fictibacillus macauensis ZFHKF-1]